MNLSLKGKTAVVTGAAKGIGRSIAEKMAESGAAVGIIDFDKATGFAAQEEFTAKGYKCVFAAADVSNYESLVQAKQQLVDAFGKIDILVINAGVSRKHTIAEIEPAEWERVISINLSGSFYTVKAFYDCFADKKPEDEGRIIFVTSGSGITGTVGAFMSTAGRNLFRLLHGEADALFLFIHFQHDDLDDVADGHDLGRVLDELVRHLRDVDKSILMHADVHEHAEVDDVAHRAGQHHAGL